ncbi:MAG: PilZ domain-containing protein [Deltaproteobacteria bacterium]|nr:PilZ domain-containing protein [Deltaproteobacteria bacterium]
MKKTDKEIALFEGIEKRAYFRVDASLPITYEKVSQQTIQSAADLNQPPNETKNTNTEILQLLKSMEQKLDFIVKYIAREHHADITSFEQNKREVNISASGLRFRCAEEFKQGDIVKINLDIPGYPYMLLGTAGEVVRAEKTEEAGSIYYDVAVRFIDLNDEKRSAIIQHLFEVQRKSLKDITPQV